MKGQHLKQGLVKFALSIFLIVSLFQCYRLVIQGLAEFQFKPVIIEIPKAYSLNLQERQESIANISNGALWLDVLNRIRFAILLDPEQARYHRWLGLAFTARSAAVPPGTELQQNLLLEADRAFVNAFRLNRQDPYILEHVLLTKARLGLFDEQTISLFAELRRIAPRESNSHLQVLLEFLPRYFGMSPEIKSEIDQLYVLLNKVGGERKIFEIRSYSNRLRACKPLSEEEELTGNYLRWPVHICNDIARKAVKKGGVK
jgi:hypothetical protein